MKGHIADKNGRYYAVFDIGSDPATGKRRQKWIGGFTTKRDAQKALTAAVSQVNTGKYILPNRETIAELCRNYCNTTGANRVRSITLQSYSSMLKNHVISRLGSKRAFELTADDLNQMMADMVKAGKSVTTTRYVLRIVHRILKDAVQKGKLVRNVSELCDPPPARKAGFQVWDETEIDRFLTAAAESRYYELYSTLLSTGARRSEAIGLKWSDVDLHNDFPKICIRRTAYKLDNGEWQFEPPKTKRSRREIDMPYSLLLLLRRVREQQEANSEWAGRKFSKDEFVFARPDGTLPDPPRVSKMFNQLIKRVGLKRIRLHDLRHTYATLQRKYGVPIEAISKVLGHASEIVTLTIYDHWEGESRAAADTFDTILENISKQRDVRKMLENEEGIESRPYRSRTCDTLIKSQVLIFSDLC